MVGLGALAMTELLGQPFVIDTRAGANSAIGAAKAGAAVVHIHVRDPKTGKPIDVNVDNVIDQRDMTLLEANDVVKRAHQLGLVVHPFTFRNEAKYLAGVYKGDPAAELLAFFRAGVDGVFTDFANTAVLTRTTYLKETGR